MTTVRFIEFVLPNGMQKEVEIPVFDSDYSKVRRILDSGLLFTCEVLRTTEFVLYIGDEEEDYCIVICESREDAASKLPELLTAGIQYLESLEYKTGETH